MLHRCYSPKHSRFYCYGARGVKVCRRWKKFENFLADMEPTFRPGLTLERINNRKSYSKENCRWATYGEQMRNTSYNVMIDTPWGRMCLKDAGARSGIRWLTLRNRIHVGWHPSLWFTPVVNGGDRRSSQAQIEQEERRVA
jgi:hypothetical protein